jgi:hypothetical protein
MSAGTLLSRLEAVRRTGPDRWIAKCPAHDDRRASLSVRELGDGRVLVHDFAGCDVESVLGAVGLDFEALYPEAPLGHAAKREARPFPAIDVLRCVSFEALVVLTAGAAMLRGELIEGADRERLVLAVARIQNAVDIAEGAR